MANVLYPKFKEKLLNPGTLGQSSATSVDLVDDVIRIALVDTGTYTYSATHEFLSDVTGVVGTAQTLASKTVTNGVFDAADVTFTGLTGDSVEAYIIYKNVSGVPGSSSLIAYFDTATSGLPFTPNGGNLTIQFNASGIFAL